MYLLFFPLPFESFENLKQLIVNIFEAVFWILDFEKHVYVRTTNSITAIVTEWIFYGLPLFTGFDFWI